MNLLKFIDTNIGTIALRRHENAENLYFTQVWGREQSGEWKRRHLYSREKCHDINPGILEALYQGAKEHGLSYEDWW